MTVVHFTDHKYQKILSLTDADQVIPRVGEMVIIPPKMLRVTRVLHEYGTDGHVVYVELRKPT